MYTERLAFHNLPAFPQPRWDYVFFVSAFLIFITQLLSVALVKFGAAGLPLRALFAVLIVVFTALSSPWILIKAVRLSGPAILFVVVCAFLAAFSSLLNDALIADLGRQILEIHFQAIVGLIVGSCLVYTMGPVMVVKVFALVIAISSFFALLQFLGLSQAWEIRDALQRLQPIEVDQDSIFLALRLRAMGLSFSPVHLATQVCLAFAGLFMYIVATRPPSQQRDLGLRLTFFLFVSIAVCVVSGNRSPLLGFVVFLVLYFLKERPALAVLIIVTLLPFAVLIDDIMQLAADMGFRVGRTEDGSSEGRQALRRFGILLILDRPYGYGLSFNSTEHWFKFWEQIKYLPNPGAIRIHALHNYYMMVLNKHGLLILSVFLFIAYRLFNEKLLLLAFTPYMIHIFYHNDGPLQGDFLIWYVLPSILVMNAATKAQAARPPRLPPST